MTFAIFALAVALPHQNAPHTLDGWGGHADLAPEVVLPTDELDRVKRYAKYANGSTKKNAGKCAKVFKTCAPFLGYVGKNWIEGAMRVDIDQMIRKHGEDFSKKIYPMQKDCDAIAELIAANAEKQAFRLWSRKRTSTRKRRSDDMEMPMTDVVWAPSSCEFSSTKGQ